MTDEVLSTSRIAADALKASDIIGSLSQATLDKLGGFAVRQTLAAHKNALSARGHRRCAGTRRQHPK
jgi:hypothetical protein